MNEQNVQITDPDILALQNMNEDEQLWFFLDDVVPTDTSDTEIILVEDPADSDDEEPSLTIVPKTYAIIEEISIQPNHAAKKYPTLVKFFPYIDNLYKNVIQPDTNPIWVANPHEGTTPQSAQQIITMLLTGQSAYLSLTPKPNSVPYKLIYGDKSHKHDFVGIVYCYM